MHTLKSRSPSDLKTQTNRHCHVIDLKTNRQCHVIDLKYNDQPNTSVLEMKVLDFVSAWTVDDCFACLYTDF